MQMRLAVLIFVEFELVLLLLRVDVPIRGHDRVFLVAGHLLPLHHDFMAPPPLCVLVLGRAPLRSPSHFVALAGFFEHLHAVQIFHCYEPLLEVVLLEILV